MNVPQNKLLLVGGGIGGLLLLVELVFVVTGSLGLRAQNRLLDVHRRDLARLQSRAPYPSEENVDAVRANLEMLEYEVGELEAALIRDPFPKDAAQSADFSARAQNVIERFRKNAERSGVKLPEGLEVGFADYASGGAVPEKRHVPRLSRQLYSVERVADVLVDCGVGSIDSLTRDSFETEPPPQNTRGRRSSRNTQKQTPKVMTATEIHSGNLYQIERVGVAFTAPEEVVWRVLDRFAASPHFMVVAGFSHATQTKILNYNPEKAKHAGEGDDETLSHLSGGILVGEKALSRPERIISGNESVKVTLSIEVYNFNPVEEGKR